MTDPIDPRDDMDRMPWLRYVTDFGKLPAGAQLAFALLLAVFVGLTLGMCAPRLANAAEFCERIRDPDRRNMCRATSRNERSFCERIRNADLRNECRAQVKRKR